MRSRAEHLHSINTININTINTSNHPNGGDGVVPCRHSNRSAMEEEEGEEEGEGEDVQTDPHYSVDSLRPKCAELQRACEQYKDLLRRRRSLLSQSHRLHETLHSAHHWCSQGVDLLASQTLDRCRTARGAEESLQEIDGYLRTFRHLRLSDPPQQLKSSFGDVLNAESRASVQQVLQRVEDVQAMCEKRKHSLRRLCRQSPSPNPPDPHPAPSSTSHPHHHRHHHHQHHHDQSLDEGWDSLTHHPRDPRQVDSSAVVRLRRKGSAAANGLEGKSSSLVDKGVKRRPSDSQLPRNHHTHLAPPFNPHPHHPQGIILPISGINGIHNIPINSNSSGGSSSSGVSSKTSSIAASSDASSSLSSTLDLTSGVINCSAVTAVAAAAAAVDVSAAASVGSNSSNSGGGGDSGSGGGGGDGGQRDSLASATSVCSLPGEADVLQAKRRHVMNELIETEKTYVTELHEILWGYCREMESRALQHVIPQELIGQKHVLFGNLEQIYKFHAEIFLQELQECRHHPAKVGRCFVNRIEEFQMYSIYCQNKPKSEALRMRVGDSNPFFKECQRKLGHRLPLGAYLLKPVQRITKYQLLLKEMLKFTGEDDELANELQAALDTMLSVLQYVNASMHQVHIVGYQDNLLDLGRLLLHGAFSVSTEHKRERIRDLRFKPMQRHIFLYERGLLLCKKKEDSNDDPVYTFKNQLKLSQVGLTEKLRGDKRKFELWSRGREEVVIIQAPSLQVKDVWVKEIKRVLMNQFDQIRSHHKLYVPSMSHDESSVSSQMSSDSSDYSLDNCRSGGGGGGGGGPITTTTTLPSSSSSSAPTSTPSTAYNFLSHQHHHSTIPVGMEMVSPLTPPPTGPSPFPHHSPPGPPPSTLSATTTTPTAPLTHAGSRRSPWGEGAGRRRVPRELGGESSWEETEGQPYSSSGELSSSHEEEEEEEEEGEEDGCCEEQGALRQAWVEPSYRQHHHHQQQQQQQQQQQRLLYVSLGDYEAVTSCELAMGEGEVVELLREGAHGWWYALHPASGREGWVPSTFLDPLPPPLAYCGGGGGRSPLPASSSALLPPYPQGSSRSFSSWSSSSSWSCTISSTSTATAVAKTLSALASTTAAAAATSTSTTANTSIDSSTESITTPVQREVSMSGSSQPGSPSPYLSSPVSETTI